MGTSINLSCSSSLDGNRKSSFNGGEKDGLHHSRQTRRSNLRTSEAMVQLHKRNQRIELTVQESKRTVEELHSTIQQLESMLKDADLKNQRYRQQEETERAYADS